MSILTFGERNSCKLMCSEMTSSVLRYTIFVSHGRLTFDGFTDSSRISDIGDDMLKRAMPAVSLEDAALIKRLYDMYLGTRGAEGSLPARVPLKIKILSLFCKSKQVSSFLSQSSQIIQEALTPPETTQPSRNSSITTPSLELTKLRAQVFAFTNWLARISTPLELSDFAPALVKELRAYIEGQGWPQYKTNDATSSAGELSSRAYGYESIGLLARACPEKLLMNPNLDLLRWLFTSLAEDSSSKDISANIEQALSSVLGAIGQDLDSSIQIPLTSFLLQLMDLEPQGAKTHDLRRTRYLAVRFANRCLPFNNTTARWIDIRAIGADSTERSALLEEGRKGLDPYWYRMLNPVNDNTQAKASLNRARRFDLPSFQEIVDTVFGTGSIWIISSATQIKMNNAFLPALTFCRCVLFHQALTSIDKSPLIDADWERNIDALVVNDEAVRDKLKLYFGTPSNNSQTAPGAASALSVYLRATFVGLISSDGGDASRAGDYLLELCSLSPESTYHNLSADVPRLQSSVYSSNKLLRNRSSHIFGILASLEHCDQELTFQMINVFQRKLQTWQQAIGGDVLQVHGAILAMAYFFSRSQAQRTRRPEFETMQSTFITLIVDILSETRDKMLQDAVCDAVSELALFGVLRPETVPKAYQASTLVQKLASKAKESNEKAIAALGHFAIQCGESQEDGVLLNQIIEELYNLHTVRQAEVQFAIGSALSCAAIGWQSKSLIAALDIQSSEPMSSPRTTTLQSMLDQVLLDCKTTKPALRQASVIWLLCLVQYCGHHHDVQSRLKECQIAFKGFLADRDSLNQESASRGLTLVYEKGNRSLKDDLIRDLVGSFTESKANLAGTVSQDTELFDSGALPTGDGSVTTVRIFCVSLCFCSISAKVMQGMLISSLPSIKIL